VEWINFNQTGASFSEIPQQATAGELLTMTNRGEPVIDIIPSQSTNRSNIQVAIKNTMAPKKTPCFRSEFG